MIGFFFLVLCFYLFLIGRDICFNELRVDFFIDFLIRHKFFFLIKAYKSIYTSYIFYLFIFILNKTKEYYFSPFSTLTTKQHKGKIKISFIPLLFFRFNQTKL